MKAVHIKNRQIRIRSFVYFVVSGHCNTSCICLASITFRHLRILHFDYRVPTCVLDCTAVLIYIAAIWCEIIYELICMKLCVLAAPPAHVAVLGTSTRSCAPYLFAGSPGRQ